MSDQTKAAIVPSGHNEPAAPLCAGEHPIWMRCWCWQMGRCLVDCPTADVPRPVPMTDENWKRAWMDVTGRRLYALDDVAGGSDDA